MFAFLTPGPTIIQYRIEIRTLFQRDINNDTTLGADESTKCGFAPTQICLIEWIKHYLLKKIILHCLINYDLTVLVSVVIVEFIDLLAVFLLVQLFQQEKPQFDHILKSLEYCCYIILYFSILNYHSNYTMLHSQSNKINVHDPNRFLVPFTFI